MTPTGENTMNINTTTELMMQAGKALNNRDADTLDRLMRQVMDWMQTDEEREAQITMLGAMMDALATIEDLEDAE